MTKTYDLFIFAGEMSGDLHGEKLIISLKNHRPELTIKGVGGPRMRKAGLDCLIPMEEFEVMGFIDILSSLPHLRRLFYKIQKEILTAKPKGVLFIDYPGFNLRMARSLKKNQTSSKLFQFVCPSVWAWGKKRIPLMEKNLDKLMAILPFEPDLFSSKLDVEYVGHPLVARIQAHSYDSHWKELYGIKEDQMLLTLFPGSREKELKRNLPLQIETAKRLIKEHPKYRLALSCASEKLLPQLQDLLPSNAFLIKPEHSYELMRNTHLAIATSGTVTLELALHKVPTVVTYAIAPVDLFLAKHIFRIHLPYYSLPNIILNDAVFTELFGPNLTSDHLFHAAKEITISQLKRQECLRKCERLQTLLGQKDATHHAALSIAQDLFPV